MLALRNLLRRRIRTALTVLGVAIGVASVVALVSVSRGLQGQLDDLFASGDAHLVVTKRAAADPFVSYLSDDLIERLSASPLVVAVHPFLLGAIQLPKYPFFFAYGVTDGSPFLANVRLIEGRALFDPANPERRIVVGRRAAENLEVGVGSMLELGEGRYEVVGIFDSPIPFVEAGGLLPFADAQVEAGLEGKMSGAMLLVAGHGHRDPSELEHELEAAFPEVEASPPERFTSAFDEFEVLDEAVRVFTLLAVLVGGIGVMNTMLMSVFERTREIGVLQALGWSKAMVLGQILTEASVVSLAGGVLGIALGVAGVELIGSIGDYAWLGGEYGPLLLFEAVLVGLGMGLVGAAYPTHRALAITPIEALRYE